MFATKISHGHPYHLYIRRTPHYPGFNITVCMKQNTSARLGTTWLPLNNSSVLNPGATSILAKKIASEIRFRAPNFASINVGDKYPKFCPLNFRYNPKIGILSQRLRLVVTKLPKFFLLFGELGTVHIRLFSYLVNFAFKLDVRSINRMLF